MASAVGEQLSNTYGASTREKDDGHMKKWRNGCRYFCTPALRTNAAANSGVDADGHTTECVLQAFALLAFYVDMEPRAHADAANGPDPQSAMNNLRGIATPSGRRRQRCGMSGWSSRSGPAARRSRQTAA